MERLTKNINGVICYVGEHKQNDEDVPAEMTTGAVRDVLTSLFAYEQAGLKPETIKSIVKIGAKFCKAYDAIDTKIGFDHLKELLDAESEGRLVVLPCKVGDTLYEVDLPEYGVIVCKVIYMGYYGGPFAHVPGGKMVSTWTAGVEVVEGHGAGSSYAFDSVDFGKTVFLTREEAEEALKKTT